MRNRIIGFFVMIAMLMTNMPMISRAAGVGKVNGWSIGAVGKCNITAEIDYDIGVGGTPSLKIVNHSPKSSNVYALLDSSIPVKKGKLYRYGGVVKSDNSTTLQVMINWGTRNNLLRNGNTFDFTDFELMYSAQKTENVTLRYLIEGKSDGIWFDNMYFIDVETGENLLSNPDFNEDEEEEKKEQVIKNEYQQKFFDINSSSKFSLEDALKVSSLYHHIPVFYRNITVDADDSDWADTVMSYMPVDTITQRAIFAHDDEREKDLKVDYSFAYDEEYLYMYLKVFDDLVQIYDNPSEYWRGDSIQVNLSHEKEDTGLEIGFIHNHTNNQSRVFCTSSSDVISVCKLSTKREGKYTTYEAAIPWSAKYGSTPEELLFDFIINDNDYNGRKYCLQLAPGIAETKSNAEYPTLSIIEPEQDWYAWIDGDLTVNIEEEQTFNLYITNYGNQKSFNVKTEDGEEKITLSEGEGFRKSILKTYTEEGQTEVSAEIEIDGKTYPISHKITTVRGLPTFRLANQYQKEVTALAEDLERIITKCEEQGISTAYEKVNLQTIKYFAQFMADDIAEGDRARIHYTYRQLVDLYNEAKASLEAYISGEKEPLTIPEFIDEGFEIRDTLTYAETFNGETYETRPVFFIGYGHFAAAKNEIHKLKSMGHNVIQNEIGVRHLTRSGTNMKSGGFSKANADATCEIQSQVYHSGKQAMKITNKTARTSNVYAFFDQSVSVDPCSDYEVSLWARGKNVSSLSICTDAWNERSYIDISDEWKKYTFKFTTTEDCYERKFRIITDDISDEIYFDDISVKKVGSDEELFYNGDFEFVQSEDEEYYFNEEGLVGIYTLLKRAEAANMSVDLLISPHKMYEEFIKQHPEAEIPGGGMAGYDVNHPIARQILGDYVKFLLSKIIGYKSLNSICLMNEPTFKANRSPSYVDKWITFLKEKYGTITELNNCYGSDYTDFSEIIMPTEMDANPVCLDYQTFNNIQFASFIEFFSGVIREIAPELPLHAKFMPYMYNMEEAHIRENMTGGYSLEYLEDSLEINGCDSWDFMYSIVGGRGFEMWYDYMVSIKNAPVFDTEHHIMADRFDKVYSDEYDAYATRNVWQGAIHYRAASVIWAWERSYEKNVYWGLSTHRPKAVWGAGVVVNDLNRLAYQIEAIQKENVDIGILYSDASRMYDTSQLNMIYNTYDAFMCLGKKVKFVTEIQAEKMHDLAYMVVPDVNYVEETTLDHIINYINGGGKVILVGDDCFRYTPYKKDSNAQKRQFIFDNSTVFSGIKSDGSNLVGMTQNEYRKLFYDYLKAENQMWIEVFDAKTGELCEDLEYNVGFMDNKLIVNISNEGETKDVNVYLGGKKLTESTELRSMTKQGESVTAEKYNPILLEFEITNPFFDIYGHWSEEKVLSAYDKNLVDGVSSTRFNPEKAITRAEFVTMLTRAAEIRPQPYSDVFADVKNDDWFATYMQAAYSKGIISDRYIRPNEYITREEMCDMLVRAYERDNKVQAAGVDFVDKNTITNKDSVAKAYGLGVIEGYDDGSFRPRNSLTRSEAVTVILNFYNLLG